MGLIGNRLAAWAARRPHLLLAAVPGATAARLAVEARARRYGWPLAASPADADLLVVAGEPGLELAAAIERVWAQLPGPRARVDVVDPASAGDALRGAAHRLGAAGREPADPGPGGDGGATHRGDDEGGTRGHGGRARHGDGGGAQGRGGPAHHDGDDGQGHEGHHQQGGGHGGMSMPGQLMMADRADDRDGLKLDVLHLALGPVLADWPAGLVVELTLQGDVVQQASARVLPPASGVARPYWNADDPEVRRRRRAAAHLDSLGRLWAVAGWPAGAASARRLRDDLIDGVPVAEAYRSFRRLDRRARRSRALRWATDGLGALAPADADRAGVGAAAGGDVTARWRCWLTATDRLLAGAEPARTAPGDGPARDEPARLAAATRLMVGLDLAAARLVLASFDPDPDELAALGVPR
ncbi:hypothetical protein ACIBPB_11840 [Micromonospora sp. NPDC049836]|uniref:hypothetical protein n=1 Tax=Micromonospora sp. NPDC049836 TaxID=3364274 RepID=UPI00378CE33E